MDEHASLSPKWWYLYPWWGANAPFNKKKIYVFSICLVQKIEYNENDCTEFDSVANFFLDFWQLQNHRKQIDFLYSCPLLNRRLPPIAKVFCYHFRNLGLNSDDLLCRTKRNSINSLSKMIGYELLWTPFLL